MHQAPPLVRSGLDARLVNDARILTPLRRADSSGRRNVCGSGSHALREDAGGGCPAERLAWSVVEAMLDMSEGFVGVDRQVAALREVLAEQSVGVLVG